jgi:hypothetical protein
MTYPKNVLLLASGHSSKLYHELDTSQFTIVAINNAHLLADKEMHYWVSPADYAGTPYEGSAKIIKYKDYIRALNVYGGHKECGYAITICAAYWALHTLKPDNIMLLGADMNYQKNEHGHTHFYGIGFDIRKGRPDPIKMAALWKRADQTNEQYIHEIYNRFDMISKNGFPTAKDHRPANIYNLSDDPDSLLPYAKLDWRQFSK